jgi:RHH-type proline utilization regulon transcriptional repressor/proline dehydrogenase/delta 1-pyrroline-5-carboxylate dehydrogenase
MRAQRLSDAIDVQNSTPYGLTGGIHSLDNAEIEQWKERVQVGNAYVNRSITGAVVQRQPFGGWKRSTIGPGAKAGGPDYVAQFARYEDSVESTPRDFPQWEWDASGLTCESNVFRYRPSRGVLLRLKQEDTQIIDIARRASSQCGVPLVLSLGNRESESELAARLPELARQVEFLRTVTPPGDALLQKACELGINWIDDPLVTADVIEFPRWMRQQSVSRIRHRYGLIQS